MNQSAHLTAGFITNYMAGRVKELCGMDLGDYLRFGKLSTLEQGLELLDVALSKLTEYKNDAVKHRELSLYCHDLKTLLRKRFNHSQEIKNDAQ